MSLKFIELVLLRRPFAGLLLNNDEHVARNKNIDTLSLTLVFFQNWKRNQLLKINALHLQMQKIAIK